MTSDESHCVDNKGNEVSVNIEKKHCKEDYKKYVLVKLKEMALLVEIAIKSRVLSFNVFQEFSNHYYKISYNHFQQYIYAHIKQLSIFLERA